MQFSKSKSVKEVFVIKPITIIYRKKKIEAPARKIRPVNIYVTGLFPYQNANVMPWRYDTTAYVGGKEIQFSDAEIVNIAGT